MKRALIILNIILITLVVYLDVKAFYKIATKQLDYDPVASINIKQASSPENGAPDPIANYDTIIERNLFNTKKQSAKNLNTVILETLKETNLKLKLLGTVTDDRDKAYAIIEDENTRKQNLYRTGDSVQNATVKVILRKKIVLRINNRDEILTMEETVSSKKDAGSPFLPVAATPRHISLKKSQIENAFENVNQLLSQIHIKPYFNKGKPGGLILTGIKPRSFFRKMGLRSGDILTGVDGKDIESVDDAMKFYENLKSASNVTLHLKRRGRTETINYHIE
ncbi:MAG: PDZ domain-containing protein [Deltaproteobacteria bacterium]|nr:PDZ domain-containing protein [Deltaproteobacteria bacterium]